MFRRLFNRRGGAAVAVVALSVSGITMAMSGTAGATDNQTTVISGSGSNTIYQMDVQLADLFNLAPGCNLSGGSPQPLNFACTRRTRRAARSTSRVRTARRPPWRTRTTTSCTTTRRSVRVTV